MNGLVHGAGADLGSAFWRPVFALLDACWPNLSGRVDIAARLGFPWEGCTHPFAWFDGGEALAHVGVLEHPLRIAGQDRVIAGIHAVCAHPRARGQGWVRRCMQAALAWVDARHAAAKLHTDIPELYVRFGFRTVPTHRFVRQRAGGGGAGRILHPSVDPADADVLRQALASRASVSARLSSRDPGWLVVIDAALAEIVDQVFVAVPGGVIAATWLDGELILHDLLFAEVPTIDTVLDAVPWPFQRVVFSFTPDLVDASAVPVPTPPDHGVLMVRGTFGVDEPFGVSALWEH